jgi:soluble lytic murein transglycosylase
MLRSTPHPALSRRERVLLLPHLNVVVLRAALLASALCLLTFSCSHPPDAAPSPVAAPAPVVEVAPPPPVVPSLDEVRALKTAGNLAGYESGLTTIRDAATADPVQRHRATALLALFLLEQKRQDEALVMLARAADQNPSVAPYLRLRIVDAAREAGKTTEALGAATRIVQDTPSSAAAIVARLRLPGLDALAGDAAATLTSYEATKAIAIDELTESDFVDLAKQFDAARRADLAGELRMRLLTQYPQGRLTEDTYDRVVAAIAPPVNQLSLDDSLALAAKLGAHDRYDQALDLLRRIQQRFPEAQTSAAVRNIRVRALFRSRHYSDLLRETAKETLDAPLTLLRARAAWRTGRPADFLKGLDLVEKRFKGSPEAAEAKELRARYYVTDEPRYDAAARSYVAAIDGGNPGKDGENLWNLGFVYVLAHEDDAALETFGKYEARYADGDYLSNALFWSGKLLDARGRHDERDRLWNKLLLLYPYSYYAFRVRTLTGVPPVAPDELTNGNVFPNLETLLAAVTDPRLDGVREMLTLGMNRDATREMQSVAAAYPDNLGVQFLLADVYVQGGEPFRAQGVLQRRFREFVRHGGSGIPHRFWEILFPLSYWDAISSEAVKRQVDPYLVASIIRQESGFEPATVSNAGAVGIMQIMPAEAPAIAAAAGLSPPTRQQLFDPRVNIAVGVAELAQKLAIEHGNPILAIAAYNGGEDNVAKWTDHVAVSDLDLFVDSIPFAETKLYVKIVSRNQFEYRRIYAGR